MKEEKKVKPSKPARNWSEIIASEAYKAAKTSGTLLNHISYLDDEIADNDANYFLIERVDTTKDVVWSDWGEINIKKNEDQILFEFTKESNKDFGSIFYCFDKANESSIEELNFNNLKPCKNQPLKDKFLVISTSNDLKVDSAAVFNKSFTEWHTDKPTILIEVEKSNGGTHGKHYAKVLKIFHKSYTPINN